MSEHPSDEFDRVPESSARQGVHRQRLIPARAGGLALKITVCVLALLLVVGAAILLPRLGLTGSDDSPAASAGGATASSDATPATATPSGDTGPTDGADPSESAGTPTGTATEPGSVSADRAQVVNVLNATGSPGLATVAAGRLAAAGWTSAVPGNWAGAPLDVSVVFYNGEVQRAGAEAVAEDLGITDVVDSPDVSPDISVVLGPEFQ